MSIFVKSKVLKLYPIKYAPEIKRTQKKKQTAKTNSRTGF